TTEQQARFDKALTQLAEGLDKHFSDMGESSARQAILDALPAAMADAGKPQDPVTAGETISGELVAESERYAKFAERLAQLREETELIGKSADEQERQKAESEG